MSIRKRIIVVGIAITVLALLVIVGVAMLVGKQKRETATVAVYSCMSERGFPTISPPVGLAEDARETYIEDMADAYEYCHDLVHADTWRRNQAVDYAW